MTQHKFLKGDTVYYNGPNEQFRIKYEVLRDTFASEQSTMCRWLEAFGDYPLYYAGTITTRFLFLLERGKEWNPIHHKIKELEQRHSEYLLMKKVV